MAFATRPLSVAPEFPVATGWEGTAPLVLLFPSLIATPKSICMFGVFLFFMWAYFYLGRRGIRREDKDKGGHAKIVTRPRGPCSNLVVG